MGSRRRLADLLVLTVACWALAAPAAHAYIDTGSASVIFQAVVAGIAAGWMFVKVFWQRLRRFLTRGGESVQDREAATSAVAVPEDSGPGSEER